MYMYVCSHCIVLQLNQTHYNKLIHQLGFSEGQQIIVKTSTVGSYVSTMDVSTTYLLFLITVYGFTKGVLVCTVAYGQQW